MRSALGASVVMAVIAIASRAEAQRPTYSPVEPSRTFARDGGPVVVHYTTEGIDAVLPGDADGSGVPDFVEEVADVAGDTLRRLRDEHGFRAVVSDADGSDADGSDDGGDGRLDIYLADFALGADGQFVTEACTDQPFHCSGYVVMENDFIGFSYATPSLGIRVLVSHELFHAVQAAYDSDQASVWHEGSAVWIEELLYPEQVDFERAVAGFLSKPFRPFELSLGGFGDSYPYGGAMWPYFLQHYLGDDIVAAIWERCEDTGADPGFLDAAEAELMARGTSLRAVWIEFTRWNAETGAAAAPGRYPEASRLPLAFREPAVPAPGSVTVPLEGLSARYLPISGLIAGSRIVVEAAAEPISVAARAPGVAIERVDGLGADAVANRHELVAGAGDLELILTSVTRRAKVQRVSVTVSAAPAAPVPDPEAGPDRGGCTAGGSPGAGSWLVGLALIALATARLRRRAVSGARCRRG